MNSRDARRRAIRLLSKWWLPPSNRKVLHTRMNGYELLVLANEDVGRDIHFVRRFEYNETRYLEELISAESVCIDAGANVGYFSLLMAKLASQGFVYAFEPLPLNAHLLRTSIELNGFRNIEVIPRAVGSTDGETEFFESNDSAYSSIRDTHRSPVGLRRRVGLITIDSFMRQRSIERVDVLKIDVEGAEPLVLEGARALLTDSMRKPRVVMLELVPQNLAVFGCTPALVIERMRQHGYAPFFVDRNRNLIDYREELLVDHYNVFFLATPPKN